MIISALIFLQRWGMMLIGEITKYFKDDQIRSLTILGTMLLLAIKSTTASNLIQSLFSSLPTQFQAPSWASQLWRTCQLLQKLASTMATTLQLNQTSQGGSKFCGKNLVLEINLIMKSFNCYSMEMDSEESHVILTVICYLKYVYAIYVKFNHTKG